jgi:hypothetical protein
MNSFWHETYQKLILVPKNISLNIKSLKIGQFLPFCIGGISQFLVDQPEITVAN